MTAVEVVKAITAAGLKITPDVLVTGGDGDKNGAGGSLVNLLLANLVQSQVTQQHASRPPALPPTAK